MRKRLADAVRVVGAVLLALAVVLIPDTASFATTTVPAGSWQTNPSADPLQFSSDTAGSTPNDQTQPCTSAALQPGPCQVALTDQTNSAGSTQAANGNQGWTGTGCGTINNDTHNQGETVPLAAKWSALSWTSGGCQNVIAPLSGFYDSGSFTANFPAGAYPSYQQYLAGYLYYYGVECWVGARGSAPSTWVQQGTGGPASASTHYDSTGALVGNPPIWGCPYSSSHSTMTVQEVDWFGLGQYTNATAPQSMPSSYNSPCLKTVTAPSQATGLCGRAAIYYRWSTTGGGSNVSYSPDTLYYRCAAQATPQSVTWNAAQNYDWKFTTNCGASDYLQDLWVESSNSFSYSQNIVAYWSTTVGGTAASPTSCTLGDVEGSYASGSVSIRIALGTGESPPAGGWRVDTPAPGVAADGSVRYPATPSATVSTTAQLVSTNVWFVTYTATLSTSTAMVSTLTTAGSTTAVGCSVVVTLSATAISSSSGPTPVTSSTDCGLSWNLLHDGECVMQWAFYDQNISSEWGSFKTTVESKPPVSIVIAGVDFANGVFTGNGVTNTNSVPGLDNCAQNGQPNCAIPANFDVPDTLLSFSSNGFVQGMRLVLEGGIWVSLLLILYRRTTSAFGSKPDGSDD